MNKYTVLLFSTAAFAGGILLGRIDMADSGAHEAPRIAAAGVPARLPTGHVAQDKILADLVSTGRKTNGSALYNLGLFNDYSSIWREHGQQRVSPVILEIGPGPNLSLGTLLVAAGGKKYFGLDLYEGTSMYSPQTYVVANELLALVSPAAVRLKPDQVYSIERDRIVFKPERIEYLFPRQSYDIPLPDASIDYVFSHSVFEHIQDPARTVASIHRVLRHGGLSAHHFDLRDHRDFSMPLEFLKLDEAQWRSKFTGQDAYRYTNRDRLSDFVALFNASGFEIVKIEPTARIEVDDHMRKALDPRFQKYTLEDLGVMSALIVAKRRGP
jgi:SAM-dependent methyltransferase